MYMYLLIIKFTKRLVPDPLVQISRSGKRTTNDITPSGVTPIVEACIHVLISPKWPFTSHSSALHTTLYP